MAGTEKSGFANAFPELFENRPWALTPPIQRYEDQPSSGAENLELKMELLEHIISLTGARIIHCSAEEHDKAVSLISHLPLFLSICLLNTVNNLSDDAVRTLALSLASSGFDSMTRLARGNPVLNADLLTLNELEVLNAYKNFLNEGEAMLEKMKERA